MELTYWRYLKLEELLKLQVAQSDPEEHDELLFIVIHQVYELWFKLLLHELDRANVDLVENRLYDVMASFKRGRMIMKTLVGQLDILETMTPMSFGSFRERLDTSSGFQSTQFREFEFVLGYKREQVLAYYDDSTPGFDAVMRRYEAPCIVDSLYRFLQHNGVTIPDELLNRDVKQPCVANEAVQDGLLMLYRERPDLVILLELMTDFDEGQQEWRYRHVKIVERTIGAKRGTGGSLGVEFLKNSMFKPIFPDLWAIRHKL